MLDLENFMFSIVAELSGFRLVHYRRTNVHRATICLMVPISYTFLCIIVSVATATIKHKERFSRLATKYSGIRAVAKAIIFKDILHRAGIPRICHGWRSDAPFRDCTWKNSALSSLIGGNDPYPEFPHQSALSIANKRVAHNSAEQLTAMVLTIFINDHLRHVGHQCPKVFLFQFHNKFYIPHSCMLVRTQVWLQKRSIVLGNIDPSCTKIFKRVIRSEIWISGKGLYSTFPAFQSPKPAMASNKLCLINLNTSPSITAWEPLFGNHSGMDLWIGLTQSGWRVQGTLAWEKGLLGRHISLSIFVRCFTPSLTGAPLLRLAQLFNTICSSFPWGPTPSHLHHAMQIFEKLNLLTLFSESQQWFWWQITSVSSCNSANMRVEHQLSIIKFLDSTGNWNIWPIWSFPMELHSAYLSMLGSSTNQPQPSYCNLPAKPDLLLQTFVCCRVHR